MRKVLFIAAVTLLLQLAPGASPTTDRIPSPFGVMDACAQTGTCKHSALDICFVNGVGFMDREWIPAG